MQVYFSQVVCSLQAEKLHVNWNPSFKSNFVIIYLHFSQTGEYNIVQFDMI